MTITGQAAAPLPSLAAQALGFAFPDVPGFKGQGWSNQETAMAVRWLLGTPAAWEQAMATARAYPGNPHTVADTLHEQVVPRSELEAIAQAGGDPAKVNWLEVAHELIERRDDPRPAGVSLAAEQEPDTISGQAGSPDTEPVPDDPTAIAMFTAHRVDDAGKHLAHASERLDAARDATGALRAYHMDRCGHHLDGAHVSAHQLAAHLRDRYPDEGRELDALTQTVGLAVSVSPQARTATTAHLTQTVCSHLAHTLRHVAAMGEDPAEKVWDFNVEHAATHLSGAAEHVGKLRAHLRDNYDLEAKFLAGLQTSGEEGSGPPSETISKQAGVLALNFPVDDIGRDSGAALKFGQALLCCHCRWQVR